jgi:hypothetical protein
VSGLAPCPRRRRFSEAGVVLVTLAL